MSAVDASAQRTRPGRAHRGSLIWAVVAAGLFLASAALQLEASLQRWVVFRAPHPPEDFAGEDHLYDYSHPAGEWEPIGTAAQGFGLGMLILAVGVLAMAFSFWALPRPSGRHVAVVAVVMVVEVVLTLIVATAYGVSGAHALISGVSGSPSSMVRLGVLDLAACAGLVALCLLWRRSQPTAAACLFLIGAGPLGFLLANFVIAPFFAGYVSHDTTPWTETVVAASTAAAAVAMLLAARAARRGARPVGAPHSPVS